MDCDLETLSALETFLLDNFKGVLVVVSHDRSFADRVTDHLFVFEGNGIVKDFQGSLSEYASCLIELENEKIAEQMNPGIGENASSQVVNFKEERAKRNEVRNFVRNAKKQMKNLETSMEKLKGQVEKLQMAIDNSSDEGWTVLADLTDQLNQVNEEIEEKELAWLELAEEVEESESE